MDDRADDAMVARTILEQLGGRRFTTMTGANSFVSGDAGLTFRIPSRGTRLKGSMMRITLTTGDEYRIEYQKVRNYLPVLIEQVDGVQASQLRTVFTRLTGLDTSLGRAA